MSTSATKADTGGCVRAGVKRRGNFSGGDARAARLYCCSQLQIHGRERCTSFQEVIGFTCSGGVRSEGEGGDDAPVLFDTSRDVFPPLASLHPVGDENGAEAPFDATFASRTENDKS